MSEVERRRFTRGLDKALQAEEEQEEEECPESLQVIWIMHQWELGQIIYINFLTHFELSKMYLKHEWALCRG